MIDCQYESGRRFGEKTMLLGRTSTSTECWMRVKEFDHEANGVIWQSSNTMTGGEGRCFAVFDTTYIVDENPAYQSCIIKG